MCVGGGGGGEIEPVIGDTYLVPRTGLSRVLFSMTVTYFRIK